MAKIFIPGRNEELPTCYGIAVMYNGGCKEEFEATEHSYPTVNKMAGMEIVTADNSAILIPLSVIVRIEFDKRWMKIVEIKRKEENVSRETNGG